MSPITPPPTAMMPAPRSASSLISDSYARDAVASCLYFSPSGSRIVSVFGTAFAIVRPWNFHTSGLDTKNWRDAFAEDSISRPNCAVSPCSM